MVTRIKKIQIRPIKSAKFDDSLITRGVRRITVFFSLARATTIAPFVSDVNGSMIGFMVFRIHARMAAVVEEPAEGEFEEGVEGMFAVVQRIVQFILVAAIPQFIRNDRIEVGRVGGETNLGDVRRRLVAQSAFEIHAFEERVRLQFTGAASSASLIRRRA
jgi:hypothetical protein